MLRPSNDELIKWDQEHIMHPAWKVGREIQGVVFEKGQIELLAKPVDDKILEALFILDREKTRLYVTRHYFKRPYQTEIQKGTEIQRQGIIKELP